MYHEVVKIEHGTRVEAIDLDSGECFVTIFYGPLDFERATHYAASMNGESVALSKEAS